MNNVVLSILSSLIIVSCSSKLRKVETFYDSGNIREFYYIDDHNRKQDDYISYFENGRIDFKTKMFNDQINDTIYEYDNTPGNPLVKKEYRQNDNITLSLGYYPNGHIYNIGRYDDKKRKIGNWIYFNKTGDTSAISEYKIIKGESYTNQIIIKDTTSYESNSGTSFHIKADTTTVKLGDSIRVLAQSVASAFESGTERSDFYIVKPQKGFKFTPDFSGTKTNVIVNEPQKIILSLKYYLEDKQKRKILNKRLQGLNVPLKEYYKTVIFYHIPHKIGKDTIRGFFNEIIARTPNAHNLLGYSQKRGQNDSIIRDIRTIYYDIPIEVVE